MRPLLDILYIWNAKLLKTSRLWERTKVNSALRFLIRATANNIIPLIYRWKHNASQQPASRECLPIIVSLTSFPARINKVWIVIEAMLRQKTKPEKIILWLSENQFPGGIESLPDELVLQQRHGLEIRFVQEDYRSHKKYYYTFHEFPDKHVLTIDDDLLFPSDFVERIYRCSQRHPNSVIANFGSKTKWNHKIGYIEKIHGSINPEDTGKHLFFGSGGGTLFKPGRLMPYLDDISTIWELCPTADDIYLNTITRLSGMNVTFMDVYPLLSIETKGDIKLTEHNGNLYDQTSKNADQFRVLLKYCRNKYNVNPFATE